MDIRIELISVPVSDVDRAIAFYRDQIGFILDHDHRVSEEIRFVQMTPPGSACSILIGDAGMTEMPAGSQKGIQAVIPDADAAHGELLARGVAVSAVDEQPWGRFVYFSDPDGNSWAYQQIPRQD